MYINGRTRTFFKQWTCIVVLGFSFDYLDFSVIYSSEGQPIRAGSFGRACIDVIMVKFTLKV